MTFISNFFVSLACITFLHENPQAIQEVVSGVTQLIQTIVS